MKDIVKLCLSLGFFCAVSGAALAFVNKITAEPCRRAEEIERTAKLKLVLPAETADTQREETIDGVQFFRALDAKGNLLAYAAEGVSNSGFGGELRVLAGLSPEGTTLGILVSKHNETPGIGTLVTDRKATRSFWEVLSGTAEIDPFPANACLDSYSGKSVSTPFTIGGANGVVGVSGATISSKAVLAAVNSISQAWQKKSLSALTEEK
jgi:RnfABCDGE-type electron transport complex G subunit